MAEFFRKLFDSSDFMPRRECGGWTEPHMWLHIGSDAMIWLSYVSIPMLLVFFAYRRQVPFHRIFFLFAAFILACGFTHLVDTVTFYTPVYRLLGLLKFVTAVVSCATVVALVPALPRALAWLDRVQEKAGPIAPPVPTESEVDNRLRHYITAILAATLAILVRAALNPFLQSDHAFVLSLLAVVAVAWQGGFGPALVTLVLSLSGTIYFFLEPRWALTLLSRNDQIAVAMFFVCGLVAALLGEAQRTSRRQAEDNLAEAVRKRAALEAEVAYRREIEADRARAAERLRQSEERYRGLTQAVPQMVRVTDAAGVMTFCNQRWVDYTGIALEEGRKNGWMSAVHPDDVPALTAAWQAALGGQTPRMHHEYRLRRAADGVYRWMLSVAVPSRDERGVIEWVGTLTDIDDQKRAAEHLERMVRDRTTELSRANEALRGEVEERGHAEARERAAAVELLRSNQELEQFAYVASHDLQEPLRKIQAFGDRLRQRFHDQLAEQGRDYIDRMLSSAVRMRRLIDDLLMFSRVTTKPQLPVPIDLDAILGGVLADMEVGIENAGATVEAGPLPELEADPMQMRQLFQNLIGNALKFAAPETPPQIRISAERAEPPVTDAAAGDWWAISFADNGIGFDEKYTDRIFQVFQRLHGRDEYEGTGVGLAICRKIAERHGGVIAARSRPGEGATFIVTLPAIQRVAVVSCQLPVVSEESQS